LEADSPPSGPCARLKPNSNSLILFPAAIRYLAALVAIKLQQITHFTMLHHLQYQFPLSSMSQDTILTSVLMFCHLGYQIKMGAEARGNETIWNTLTQMVRYNIQMDLQEIGWGVGWIDLAQYRGKCGFLMIMVIHFQVS